MVSLKLSFFVFLGISVEASQQQQTKFDLNNTQLHYNSRSIFVMPLRPLYLKKGKILTTFPYFTKESHLSIYQTKVNICD